MTESLCMKVFVHLLFLSLIETSFIKRIFLCFSPSICTLYTQQAQHTAPTLLCLHQTSLGNGPTRRSAHTRCKFVQRCGYGSSLRSRSSRSRPPSCLLAEAWRVEGRRVYPAWVGTDVGIVTDGSFDRVQKSYCLYQLWI